MRQLLRRAVYQLTRKRVDEGALSPVTVHLNREEISCFALSTNPIWSFYDRGELYYFRRCPELGSRRAYYRRNVEEFFSSLNRLGIEAKHFRQEMPIALDFSPEQVAEFRDYVNRRLAQPRFWRILYRADRLWGGRSIWDGQPFGEDFFRRFSMEDRGALGVYFLWCIRSAAINYPFLRIVRGKGYSHFGAVRAVASGVVAKALGLEHLLTDARYCLLKVSDGEEYLGILSPAAPGERMLDSGPEPTGELQRELSDLFLLDGLCHQPDHGANNYNVYLREGKLGVCAFDNDNPMTFFPRGWKPVPPRYVADTTVRALERLDWKSLNRQLRPWLNFLQRQAVRRRGKQLLCWSRQTALVTQQWNEETLARELRGDFGSTELTRIRD